MLWRITRLLISLAVLVLFFTISAAAQNNLVSVGTDYLATGPGTSLDLSDIGFSSSVQFKSNPSALVCMGLTGNTVCSSDTIMQRQEDLLINPTNCGAECVSGPLQMVYLSTCSVDTSGKHPGECNPILNDNGFHYIAYGTLDPGALPDDTGTMTIMGDSSGGTENSTVQVAMRVTFQATDGGPAIPDYHASVPLTSSGAAWTSTAPNPANYFEVVAPYPSQQANVNTNLPRRPQIVIVNFFFVTFVREFHPSRACHVAGIACVGGIAYFFPPPFAYFWLICVIFAPQNGLSLDQVADLMVPPVDFGAMDTQIAAWDKVQEPVSRAPIGLNRAAGLPRLAGVTARN